MGDARATDRSEKGEVSIGQLVRERYQDVMLIGFTTHHGTVTAASNWDRPAERKIVRPALPDSHEAIFHETGRDGLLLPCVEDEDVPVPDELREPLLQRAIGVIYSPDTERQSHYFHARLMRQFDAVVHIDETHAVEPLEPGAIWNVGEVPETYPFAV
jgi:erythromycin esterase-like protein